MGVIFDLDQTLVDSSIALSFRDRRNWQKVYSLIPKFKKYPGVDHILSWLTENEIPLCIVTNTPRTYCSRIVNNFGWDFDGMVCYHDTSLHKPNPEPILKALEILDIEPSHAISVGDQSRDIIASKRAGVTSVAAAWGSNEIESLLRVKPHYFCKSAKELKQIFLKKFKNVYGL